MKKGFTLIELLAVIVILAIIAVIAVPIVLNIINDSKKNASLRSAEMYLDAVELSVANSTLKGQKVETGTYNIMNDGNICLETYDSTNKICKDKNGNTNDDKYILKVEVKGETPKEGTITISKGEIISSSIKINDQTITKNSEGEIVYANLADTIINHAKNNNYYYITAPNFANAIGANEFGLYKTKDDLGESYYFRGNPTNNYVAFILAAPVKFYYHTYESWEAFDTKEECESSLYPYNRDFYTNFTCEEADYTEAVYWRIVRINGDGTIRLIYAGKTQKRGMDSNGTYTNNVIDVNFGIEGIAFNSQYTMTREYDKYLGYTNNTSDTDDTQIDSDVKKYLDKWYDDNLKNTYGKYISDGIFCNDREMTSTTETNKNYGAYDRNEQNTPTLICKNKEDRYTVSTKLGNGHLTDSEGNARPIGLITADEVMFAGGIGNTNHYLYFSNSYNSYWTMSPSNYYEYAPTDFFSYLIFTQDSGQNPNQDVYARPVINFKADVKFKGSGTMDDPYVIITE